MVCRMIFFIDMNVFPFCFVQLFLFYIFLYFCFSGLLTEWRFLSGFVALRVVQVIKFEMIIVQTSSGYGVGPCNLSSQRCRLSISDDKFYLLQNILITSNGAWKLGGFGFAISTDQAISDSSNVLAFHYAVSDFSQIKNKSMVLDYYVKNCFSEFSSSLQVVISCLVSTSCYYYYF